MLVSFEKGIQDIGTPKVSEKPVCLKQRHFFFCTLRLSVLNLFLRLTDLMMTDVMSLPLELCTWPAWCRTIFTLVACSAPAFKEHGSRTSTRQHQHLLPDFC